MKAAEGGGPASCCLPPSCPRSVPVPWWPRASHASFPGTAVSAYGCKFGSILLRAAPSVRPHACLSRLRPMLSGVEVAVGPCRHLHTASSSHENEAEGGRSGGWGSNDLHPRILCAYARPAHGPSGKPPCTLQGRLALASLASPTHQSPCQRGHRLGV